MAIRIFITIVAFSAMGIPAMAQNEEQPVQNTQLDCTLPANAEACADLPGDDVTNFVPLIAPIAGLLGLGALAGGGSSTSTTSTPSTTN
ncbi:MAG: hypothetical protein COB16_17485 [Rhodobacteraceae bacterium]|nr:MAG: hypothetical protein COB16_17485 [Paracoccaceae bacterium]